VIGSNIFNILGVLAISSILTPIAVPSQALGLDIPVMIDAAIVCAPIMMRGLMVSRFEGAILLLCYVAYVAP